MVHQDLNSVFKELEMDILKELESYRPYNEDEKDEVRAVKQFLSAFGDFAYLRECLPGHIVSLVWVMNPERTKSLLGFHNIFKSYTWFGGHADGEKDMLKNAKKELFEETGIENVKILNDAKPFEFGTMNVISHIKNGKRVPEHIHLYVGYAFEIDEKEPFRIAEAENSAIEWVDNEKILEIVRTTNDKRIEHVYKRIIEKVEKL